jgi:arsenite methyltransferase
MTTDKAKSPIKGEVLRRRTKPPPGRKRSTGYLFTGPRAQLFKEAIKDYPHARRDDLALMHKYLDPRLGEHVLGFGEGSGYFCRAIAESVGPTGKYIITEPSPELFCNIPQEILDLPHVFTEITAVEEIQFPEASFDKAWACGAFHHCPNQTEAISRIFRALKPGGTMVLFDVFQGTPLARHFDASVARYCATGHEVKFMSEEFARTLCFLAGFDERKVRIEEVPHRFCFDSEWDMGTFIYKMHAMIRVPGTTADHIARTLSSLKEHLQVDREGEKCVLHFDQKALIATR